jgi:hypothetical protein
MKALRDMLCRSDTHTGQVLKAVPGPPYKGLSVGPKYSPREHSTVQIAGNGKAMAPKTGRNVVEENQMTDYAAQGLKNFCLCRESNIATQPEVCHYTTWILGPSTLQLSRCSYCNLDFCRKRGFFFNLTL